MIVIGGIKPELKKKKYFFYKQLKKYQREHYPVISSQIKQSSIMLEHNWQELFSSLNSPLLQVKAKFKKNSIPIIDLSI